MNKSWSNFCKLSGYAALFQFLMIIVMTVGGAIAGSKPQTVIQYYTIANESLVKIIFAGDLAVLVMLLPYYLTFLSLWKILGGNDDPKVLISVIFTYIALSSIILLNNDFALIKLAGEYAKSVSDIEKQTILAAGKSLFVSDMWNSTAAYLSGIFYQGAGLLISFVILRSKQFNKWTAYTGIWGNGFDLLQHVIHPILPGIAQIILMIAGPGYLLWFIFLGRDLIKISNSQRVTLGDVS